MSQGNDTATLQTQNAARTWLASLDYCQMEPPALDVLRSKNYLRKSGGQWRGEPDKGARTIVGSNLQDRWFSLFGFEKKDRETIDARELGALQVIAVALLAMEPKLLEKALVEGELECLIAMGWTPPHS